MGCTLGVVYYPYTWESHSTTITYSLSSFLLPFFMASLTTLSLKSVRVAHLLRHLCFLACTMEISTCVFHCFTHALYHRSRPHPYGWGVAFHVTYTMKICNILSIRRTLDISSKNRCCNCDLYSGKYGMSFKQNSVVQIHVRIFSVSFSHCSKRRPGNSLREVTMCAMPPQHSTLVEVFQKKPVMSVKVGSTREERLSEIGSWDGLS